MSPITRNRFIQFTKTVPYGKKQPSQKNGIDFFLREFKEYFPEDNSLVCSVENYTGIKFRGVTPVRTLGRCLRELAKDGIITKTKRNGVVVYRHSIHKSPVSPIIEEDDTDEDSSSDNSNSSSDEESDEEKKECDEERLFKQNEIIGEKIRQSNSRNSAKKIKEEEKYPSDCKSTSEKVNRINKRYITLDNPIRISECNLSWKRVKTPEEEKEDNDVMEIERGEIEDLINRENSEDTNTHTETRQSMCGCFCKWMSNVALMSSVIFLGVVVIDFLAAHEKVTY